MYDLDLRSELIFTTPANNIATRKIMKCYCDSYKHILLSILLQAASPKLYALISITQHVEIIQSIY